MRFKVLLLTIALTLPWAGGVPAEAQTGTPVPARPANAEAKRLAEEVIERFLQVSHLADLYQGIRRTVSEVYIPALRDTLQGDVPGFMQPEARKAATLAKTLTFLTYAKRAADELDPTFNEYRADIVSDVADQIVKTITPSEISDLQTILKLPAVTKGFDALEAASKLITGFTYEDARTFADFSAWMQGLQIDLSKGLPNLDGPSSAPVPSQSKMAKAQGLVDDLFKISHFEEIVSDVKRFMRDVYLETAPLTADRKDEMREKLDQYEFAYNFQKAIVLAALPSVIAASLTDEQLNVIHTFVRSDAYIKAFTLLREAVHVGTSFTKDEVLEAERGLSNLKAKMEAEGRTALDSKQTLSEWDALVTKWTGTLKNRLSPETLAGLEAARRELQLNHLPG